MCNSVIGNLFQNPFFEMFIQPKILKQKAFEI